MSVFMTAVRFAFLLPVESRGLCHLYPNTWGETVTRQIVRENQL